VFTGSLPAGNLAAAATGAARTARADGVGPAGDPVWHPVCDYGAANTDLQMAVKEKYLRIKIAKKSLRLSGKI
jgi:hypothetical protein